MAHLIRLLAVGLLGLLAVTWKLWTPQDVFPQIPLIRAACDWPAWLDWCGLATLVATAITLSLFARVDWIRRVASAGMVLSLALLFTLDQHRLQPWAWQFFLLGIVLSLADNDTTGRCWKWLVISIYFWSAISKVDYTFCHVQGPALLAGLRKAVGLQGIPTRWTESLNVYGSLGIALGELAVSILLMWRRSRLVGLWGATAMHLMLLTALGPWGLRHSYGVLTWNVYFMIQDWLLFRPVRGIERGDPALRSRLTAVDVRNRLAEVIIAAAVVFPCLEPMGLCDHWLAWAVYSARPGTVEVRVGDAFDSTSMPVQVERSGADAFLSQRLRIGQWSLDQLGVPVYPEHRFQLGVALWLKERFSLDGTVSMRGAPDRISGVVPRPTVIQIQGSSDEITARAASLFRWNVRPRRAAKNPGLKTGR